IKLIEGLPFYASIELDDPAISHAEAHAERIVVLCHPIESLRNELCLEPFPSVQHDRMIVMVDVLPFLFEQTTLNRGKPHFPYHRFLADFTSGSLHVPA